MSGICSAHKHYEPGCPRCEAEVEKEVEGKMSLCRRCEHRAIAYETKHGPRFECTWFSGSVSSCYCYEPTKPVILKKQKGDVRPQFAGWVISARSEFSGIPGDLELTVEDYKRKGKALIWRRIKAQGPSSF